MNRRIRDIGLALSLAMAAMGAQATLTTYAGLRQAGIAAPSGQPLDAMNSFLAGVVNAGTETFSSFSVGDPATGVTLGISFAGNSNSATISGDVVDGHPNFGVNNNEGGNTDGNGRYDTTGSGDRFLETKEGSGSFLISFLNPIHAFGLYLTDVGDFGPDSGVALSWILTDTIGGTTKFQVASTGVANASLLFLGFIDTDKQYTSISFNGSGQDGIGLDDMIVGDLPNRQPPGGVPEPASIMLVGLALLPLAAVRRRKR
jgi:hypothetical protein